MCIRELYSLLQSSKCLSVGRVNFYSRTEQTVIITGDVRYCF